MKDGDKLVAWLREAADELEKAHVILDQFNVPRSLPGSDVECTLAARIALQAEEAANVSGALQDVLDWASKMPGYHVNEAVARARALVE